MSLDELHPDLLSALPDMKKKRECSYSKRSSLTNTNNTNTSASTSATANATTNTTIPANNASGTGWRNFGLDTIRRRTSISISGRDVGAAGASGGRKSSLGLFVGGNSDDLLQVCAGGVKVVDAHDGHHPHRH